MYAVEAIPENQKIITSLPPNKIVTVMVTIPTSTGGATPPITANVPLILDGWEIQSSSSPAAASE